MPFGKLEITPTLSPGILDTATWDREAVWTIVQAVAGGDWLALAEAARRGEPRCCGTVTPYPAACDWQRRKTVR